MPRPASTAQKRRLRDRRTWPRSGRGRRAAARARRAAARARSGAQTLVGSSTSTPRLSRWSIAPGPVSPSRPKSSRRRAKTSGSSPGRRLRSPPKISGAVAGPLGRRPGRFEHVLARQLRLVVGRVQVGDAEAGGGAGEGHRAALGLALVDRQLAPLGDPAEPPRHPDQGQVGAALAGGHQVRVLAGEQFAQRRQAVARGQDPVPLGPAGGGQRLGEARRALLQQGDVPGGGARAASRTPRSGRG